MPKFYLLRETPYSRLNVRLSSSTQSHRQYKPSRLIRSVLLCSNIVSLHVTLLEFVGDDEVQRLELNTRCGPSAGFTPAQQPIQKQTTVAVVRIIGVHNNICQFAHPETPHPTRIVLSRSMRRTVNARWIRTSQRWQRQLNQITMSYMYHEVLTPPFDLEWQPRDTTNTRENDAPVEDDEDGGAECFTVLTLPPHLDDHPSGMGIRIRRSQRVGEGKSAWNDATTSGTTD